MNTRYNELKKEQNLDTLVSNLKPEKKTQS